MEFNDIFAVGQRLGKSGHAVTFRPVEAGVFGVGNVQVAALDHVAVHEAVIARPNIAARIRKGRVLARFDANRQLHRSGYRRGGGSRGRGDRDSSGGGRGVLGGGRHGGLAASQHEQCRQRQPSGLFISWQFHVLFRFDV